MMTLTVDRVISFAAASGRWSRRAVGMAAGAISVLAMAPFFMWPVLFLTLPVLVLQIDAAIAAVIGEAAFIGGPYVKKFEDEFAAYIGAKHCIGVANGTDAIEIALEALDLPPGSEVSIVSNAGHFLQLERPDKVAELVLAFVGSPGEVSAGQAAHD